jgi:hypothetical protein
VAYRERERKRLAIIDAGDITSVLTLKRRR